MPLKLMYITNDLQVAKIAENSGVDWIFIDLEIIGKEQRQKNLDTVISRHSIDDIKRIKQVLIKSKLIVRINPIFEQSKDEINKVITDGADIVMLPYFTNKDEVEKFISYVDKKAKTCLLLETPEAVKNIDSILMLQGIDYVHIGLNDLHIGYKMKFMFELLTNGTVEMLCEKIRKRNIQYGFGGIAQLGQGALPAEIIISEHYRLGSSMVILSRSFCNTTKIQDIDLVNQIFKTKVNEIRVFENIIEKKSHSYYEHNKEIAINKVNEIIKNNE